MNKISGHEEFYNLKMDPEETRRMIGCELAMLEEW